MKIVATYAYLNPFNTVILGRFVLGESLTIRTILGALLVLFGVAGV